MPSHAYKLGPPQLSSHPPVPLKPAVKAAIVWLCECGYVFTLDHRGKLLVNDVKVREVDPIRWRIDMERDGLGIVGKRAMRLAIRLLTDSSTPER